MKYISSSFNIIFISFMFFAHNKLKADTTPYENIKLFTTDRARPYVIIQNDQLEGILGEFLKNSTKGIIKNFEIYNLPWKRAQVEVHKYKNALIIPLAKTPLREKQYKWLIRVFDDPICFFTIKPNPKIKSRNDLLKLDSKLNTIGLLKGSTTEEYIKKFNLTNINIAYSTDYDFLAQKLYHNRINALFSGTSVIKYYWKLNKFDENLLQCGKVFYKNEEFVGAMLESDDDFIRKIKIEMDKYKKTNEYKLLLKKYGL